jgi:hypothetical protein
LAVKAFRLPTIQQITPIMFQPLGRRGEISPSDSPAMSMPMAIDGRPRESQETACENRDRRVQEEGRGAQDQQPDYGQSAAPCSDHPRMKRHSDCRWIAGASIPLDQRQVSVILAAKVQGRSCTPAGSGGYEQAQYQGRVHFESRCQGGGDQE